MESENKSEPANLDLLGKAIKTVCVCVCVCVHIIMKLDPSLILPCRYVAEACGLVA